MKKLNKKELEIIKEALRLQIDSIYEYAYLENRRNDMKSAIGLEEYAEEVEKVLRKLS